MTTARFTLAEIVRRSLTVAISGSGDVRYGGDPVVKSAITGSGELKRR